MVKNTVGNAKWSGSVHSYLPEHFAELIYHFFSKCKFISQRLHISFNQLLAVNVYFATYFFYFLTLPQLEL